MGSHDEIKEYTGSICQQIRWKKAHHMIEEEIGQHICDQRDAYMEDGADEQTATHRAVLEMGDAITVGIALDQVHRPRPQWLMLAFIAVFMSVGVFYNCFLMESFLPEYAALARQNLFWYPAALILLLFCYFLDFTVLYKYTFQIYGILILISVMGIVWGPRVAGTAYLRLGRLSLSMANLAIVFPIVFSLLIYRFRTKGYWGILCCGLFYLPFAGILLSVTTNTGFLLFSAIVFLLLVTAILKGWFSVDKKVGMGLVLIPTVVIFIWFIFILFRSPYYLNRLMAVLDPSYDRVGAGYLYSIIRDMLSNSKLLGEGSYLAQIERGIPPISVFSTDYILTYLTFHFGWITGIGIVGIHLFFTVIGYRRIKKQKSVLGTLISFSVLLSFFMNTVFYVLGNLGMGTLSSLPLPMISYGNTSLLLYAALFGFMLSVFRTGETYKDNLRPIHKAPRISYENGKLVISLKQ